MLLLHGLWMNRLVMHPLQAALAAAGYQAQAMGYRSTRGDLAEHHERLEQALGTLPAGRVHLVGHSMGGVVALSWLMRAGAAQRARIGRTVLLGAPVARCEAAMGFAAHAAGRLLMGNSIAVWEQAMPLKVPAGSVVAALAGTERFGLGPLFVTLQGDNDGVVGVAETRLPGLADHLVLPVSHTGMLFDAEVARQCVAFIRDGRFVRGAP